MTITNVGSASSESAGVGEPHVCDAQPMLAGLEGR